MASVTRSDIFTDPVQFQSAILGRKLWEGQKRIARAVATKRSISVKACHASGKTFLAAGLALWWLVRWQQGKVLTVAPTLRQVKLMWEEISLARDSSTIDFPEPSTVALKIANDRYALGMSSSRGVNVQGFHGGKVLIIVDEAPGVLAEIYDAIEGIRAGGDVTMLKLGNPVVPSGTFFEDFTRGRAFTDCHTISAFDTPNLAGVSIEALLAMNEDELQQTKYQFLISRQWVKEKYIRWGPNNPRYMARVLGEFPNQSDDSVFSLEWIEAANREPTQEEIDALKGGEIRVGIDVAGPGEDETVMVARIKGTIILQKSWSLADPRGDLAVELGKLRADPRFRLGVTMVDIVGIGYHVATHLADLGFDIHGFNAGASPVDSEHFENAKAEAYWSTREWLERRMLTGLTDEETQAQLSGIRYKHTPSGRVQIESKEDARKRGASSPDRAEAVVLAFVPVVNREQTVVYDPGYQISPY